MTKSDVDTTSSALCLSLEFVISDASCLPKDFIHFIGVISSCETEAVSRLVILLLFSTLLSRLNAVMSLIFRILHSSLLKISV